LGELSEPTVEAEPQPFDAADRPADERANAVILATASDEELSAIGQLFNGGEDDRAVEMGHRLILAGMPRETEAPHRG
jgi:hypothetical protein